MTSNKTDIIATNLLALELMENNRNLAAIEVLATAIPPMGFSSVGASSIAANQHPLDYMYDTIDFYLCEHPLSHQYGSLHHHRHQTQPGSKTIDSYGLSWTTTTPGQQDGYYNKAFLVRIPMQDNDREEWVEETSAAIIFNTALAFHREGIQTGLSVYFANAMRQYRETIVVIEKLTFQPDHRLAVILLAAVTNICQIVLGHYFDFACGRQITEYHKKVLDWAHMTEEFTDDYAFFQLQNFMYELAPDSPAPAA